MQLYLQDVRSLGVARYCTSQLTPLSLSLFWASCSPLSWLSLLDWFMHPFVYAQIVIFELQTVNQTSSWAWRPSMKPSTAKSTKTLAQAHQFTLLSTFSLTSSSKTQEESQTSQQSNSFSSTTGHLARTLSSARPNWPSLTLTGAKTTQYFTNGPSFSTWAASSTKSLGFSNTVWTSREPETPE